MGSEKSFKIPGGSVISDTDFCFGGSRDYYRIQRLQLENSIE